MSVGIDLTEPAEIRSVAAPTGSTTVAPARVTPAAIAAGSRQLVHALIRVTPCPVGRRYFIGAGASRATCRCDDLPTSRRRHASACSPVTGDGYGDAMADA